MPIEYSRVSRTGAPVLDLSAYADGDAIGGCLTFSNAVRFGGGSGMIQSLVVSDAANQQAVLDVVFFNEMPTETTFTDQDELDIGAADLQKIIGVVPIAEADYADLKNNAAAAKNNVDLSFALASGINLYACIVSRGTPTYAAADDLQLRINIIQD